MKKPSTGPAPSHPTNRRPTDRRPAGRYSPQRRMAGRESPLHAAKRAASLAAQSLFLLFLAFFSVLWGLLRPLFRPFEPLLRKWAAWHSHVVGSTFRQLAGTPLNTLMTGSVIGIALALPAGLYVFLENIQGASQGWGDTAQISVFLTMEKSDDEARAIAEELRGKPEVEQVEVITRAEALSEYQQLSGFQTLFDALDVGNPLPAVLVLRPGTGHSDLIRIRQIVAELEERADVDFAQFDLEWLRRLYTMAELVQRIILGLSALLAMGVLLIIGNTIRLDIHNRREEIEITKLFGASNAFIRRPFLYTGLWYGLLGGFIAWLLVFVFFGLLYGPMNRLAALYNTDFPPIFPGVDTLFVLVFVGAGLGLAGSWVAVSRQIGSIEPS